MRLVIAITTSIAAFCCFPNIAGANWLARCESADGLRYCEACGASGLRRNAPCSGQVRTIGIATNFVISSDFNRISTVRMPFFWASMMASRTSAGAATFFPPTSRMMSTVLTPCSEASPSGSILNRRRHDSDGRRRRVLRRRWRQFLCGRCRLNCEKS